MGRSILALLALLLLASCGARYNTPPRNLDDACSILNQRPPYIKAFKATERKWNVPVHVQMATMHQESKFDADARTPFRYALGVIPMGRQSSAFGYSQALDGTWDEYKQATGRRGAKRDNIKDASDFMGWYFNQSKIKNGIALDDARNQYLAYHEGHTGYRRGTYNKKTWLVRVANKVDSRADLYKTQLASCRKAR